MAVRVEEIREVREPSRWLHAVRDFCGKRPLGAIGAAVVVLMFLVAVAAPWLAQYDPVAVDFGAMLAAPSAKHWLGTDSFGRDVLSRVIYGSQTALVVGFGAALIGATVGPSSAWEAPTSAGA